ncbi:M20/M25/M40 family metallo-hydrolase [Patescibacteria group bacterium]
MKKQYLSLLEELISFKSVSTDKNFRGEINKTVNWLINLFDENNLETKILKSNSTNPVVFAETKTDLKETVIVYGHYDVQPASKEEGWDGDPFMLSKSDGKLVGRGVVDNKGQFLIHVVTVLNLLKTKKLKFNVKFLIEGNEETSNPELKQIIEDNVDLLKTDYILISDGEISGNNPTIEASFRGGFNMKVVLRTGKNNLHSGLYGGAVPNASSELSKIISKLFDDKGQVSFKDFYKNADTPTKKEVQNNQSFPASEEEILKLAGVTKIITENDTDFFTQTGLRPTLQITGLKSGYIEDGFANIIPAVAEVRINARIVPSQDPEKVYSSVKTFIENNTPDYVDLDFELDGPHEGIKFNLDTKLVDEAKELLEDIHQENVLFKNVGGAIPIVVDFKKVFGIDALSVSMGNDDCNMHGVNENFKINLIEKGLEFSKRFFSK